MPCSSVALPATAHHGILWTLEHFGRAAGWSWHGESWRTVCTSCPQLRMKLSRNSPIAEPRHACGGRGAPHLEGVGRRAQDLCACLTRVVIPHSLCATVSMAAAGDA